MTITRKVLSAIAVSTALILTVAGCTGPGTPAGNSPNTSDPEKITIATTITGANFLAISAAIDQGFFADHNVEAEIVSVKSSAEASAAALSGQVDVAALLGENVISVVASGGEFKLIGALLKDLQFSLVTTAGISSLEDLRGKTVSTQGKGGSEYIVKYALEDAGIDLSEVNFVALGAQTAQLAGIISGSIDAAALVPPYDIQGEANGLNRILRFAELLPNVPTASLAATPQVLESRPDAIRAFLSAATEGAQWIIANPEDAAKLLAEISDIPLDQATQALEETLPLYSTTGMIDKEGMEFWRDMGQKYGDIPLVEDITDVFDNSYLPAS